MGVKMFKKFVRFIFFVLLFIINMDNLFALPNSDYTIEKYNVDIIVNENNTIDITEMITVNYNKSLSKITKKIPIRNEIKSSDGKYATNRAEVLNFKANTEYEIKKDFKYYIISLNSENKNLETYKISYTYNLGKDLFKNMDMLYFNILNSKWDTEINNISFKIEMPKKFDMTKLKIEPSIQQKQIEYDVDGRIIKGNYIDRLVSNETLDIICELPEGYFVNAKSIMTIQDYLMYIIPLFGLLISYILWQIYGKDKKIKFKKSTELPKGLNSLDIAFLYKGRVTEDDVFTLIMYLANRGYLQIIETNEQNVDVKKSGFLLKKIKEYDGNDKHEKLFMQRLFKEDTLTIFKNEITSPKTDEEIEMSGIFYVTIKEILADINSIRNMQKIYEKSSLNKRKIIILVIVLSFLTIMLVPYFSHRNPLSIFLTLVCIIFGFIVVWKLAFNKYARYRRTLFVISIILIICMWGVNILPLVENDNIFFLAHLFGLVCIFGMIIFLRLILKRTDYGIELKENIQGFINYINEVNEEQLKMMIDINPNYVYEMFSYVYALNIEDIFMEKIKNIDLKEPVWFVGIGTFNLFDFKKCMDNVIVLSEKTVFPHLNNN